MDSVAPSCSACKPALISNSYHEVQHFKAVDESNNGGFESRQSGFNPFQFPLHPADFNFSPSRGSGGGGRGGRRGVLTRCRPRIAWAQDNSEQRDDDDSCTPKSKTGWAVPNPRRGKKDRASRPSSDRLSLNAFILVIPLAASFILTVVGIVAVIFVNRHYSEEAAATFPITITTSVSLYIRREVEAEMNVPLLAVHKPLAAMYATGLMPVPIYNATSPTTRIVPAGSNDTSLLQVRDEENVRRAKWHRQNSANSIRIVESTKSISQLRSIFANNVQSRWEHSSTGTVLVGVTHFGDGVGLRGPSDDASLIVEHYNASSGHLASAANDPLLQLSRYYNFFAYVENTGSEYYSTWIQQWRDGHSVHNMSTKEQVTMMRNAMRPRLQVTMTLDEVGVYTLLPSISSPILAESGLLVGIIDTEFDFESVGKSIQSLARTLSAVPMGSNVLVTSFILSESGTVLAATGATNKDLIIVTDTIVYDYFNQPLSPKGCASGVTFASLEGQFRVHSTCDRYPHEFTSNPVIQASAPHLASVCGDDSPLLGAATSVTLPVDGSERPFAIICEKLSSPGDSYFYESYGSNFSSWRIVTLVSERELVDPLVRVMPGTLLAAGLGIGICALACIVAGVAAYALK